MTPEPDDAEKAAAALLDSLSDDRENRAKEIDTFSPDGEAGRGLYLALSERIREGREMEERVCLRWLTYCEQQLKAHKTLPVREGSSGAKNTSEARLSSPTGEREDGLLFSLQRELYARQDIADRVGGELKNRWQHCLAEVTVRLMENTENDNQNDNENHNE